MLRSRAADQRLLVEAREEAERLRQEQVEWQREKQTLTEDVQTKNNQLEEKREQLLLAKNEAQSLRSQLDTTLVRALLTSLGMLTTVLFCRHICRRRRRRW